MKHSVTALAIVATVVTNSHALAQTAPALPESMIAAPGQTKSNSLTSGQRSSLSISTSSSIGTSVNMSATDGYSSQVQAAFTPSSGQFTSSFGGENRIIKVDVNNARSESATDYAASGDGLVVNGSKESSATGSAVIEGITAEIGATLNPAASSISASAGPAETTAGGVGNSNAAGSLNMNNGMNVDISNTSFSNAFSQAF